MTQRHWVHNACRSQSLCFLYSYLLGSQSYAATQETVMVPVVAAIVIVEYLTKRAECRVILVFSSVPQC